MSDTPRTDECLTEILDAYGYVHQGNCPQRWVYHARELERELNAANQRIKRLEDCAETAWGIIANVDSGSWQEQRADWREAATRWRDEQFHPELSERKAKEAKL